MMLPPADRVYLACGFTDMRKGFDGLAALVQTALSLDPYGGALFIFRGRRGDLVKALHWDGQGLCLYAKAGAAQGSVRVAAGGQRHGDADPRPGLDAHRRDRLAHARLDGPAGGRRLARPRHSAGFMVVQAPSIG